MYSISNSDLQTFDCTVVICTRNRPGHLRRCIEELQKQTFRAFEILVVDNSSKPSDAWHIAASYGTRYLLCPTIGLSHARNAAIAACSAEFIAFLDDDAVAEPQWLYNLLAQFSSSHVVAVTGQIILESEPTPAALNPRGFVCIDKSNHNWFEMTNFGGIGSGSNMAFRRSTLEHWFGFNECLGRGKLLNAWEDDYAFFTLVDRGLSIAYAPDAQVRHPASPAQERLLDTLHQISISGAYICLLTFEHPRYIPKISRFLLDALFRRPSAWRSRDRKAFNSSAPALLVYSALLFGPFIYFYMRIARLLKVDSDVATQSFESKIVNER